MNTPNEINLHIVSYMDLNTCKKMSIINKQWNWIIKDFFTTFFCRLLWNDFAMRSENPVEKYLHMWLFKNGYCTLKNHSNNYIYKQKIFWSIKFMRFIVKLFKINLNTRSIQDELIFHEDYEYTDPWRFDDEIILILKCMIYLQIPINCMLYKIEQTHLLFTLV